MKALANKVRVAAVTGTAAVALLSVTPTVFAAPQSDITWGPCSEEKAPADMQCATFEVPVDWSDPEGRTIELELARLPGTDQQNRLGTVLWAPGGPGSSGIDNLTRSHENFTNLRSRFDIVTTAPRTVTPGYLPLKCFTSGPSLEIPKTRSEFLTQNERIRKSVRECRDIDPARFDNLDSGSVARDMDAIRAALGERQINLMGNSYGGIPVASYARTFPQHLRAAYVDGSTNHVASHAEDLRMSYATAETQFARMTDWCDATSDCALHGEDVPTVWQGLLERAEHSPVPISGRPANEAYSDSDMLQAAKPLVQQGVSTNPRQPGWAEFAEAIDQARHGNAAKLAEPTQQAFGRSKLPIMPALNMECLDGAGVSDYAHYRRLHHLSERLSPNFAGQRDYRLLGCAWRPATNPPRPLPVNELPPFMGAGSREDFLPVEHLTSQIPGSSTIRVDGPGHGMYLSGNKCVIEQADRYLVDPAIPERHTSCPPVGP